MYLWGTSKPPPHPPWHSEPLPCVIASEPKAQRSNPGGAAGGVSHPHPPTEIASSSRGRPRNDILVPPTRPEMCFWEGHPHAPHCGGRGDGGNI